MKFRKKPVVIEAVQYRRGELQPRGVCNGGPTCETPELRDLPSCKPHLHTAHNGQSVILEDGDWIIPEPDGQHFYPCKPDIFEATYEPVKETNTN